MSHRSGRLRRPWPGPLLGSLLAALVWASALPASDHDDAERRLEAVRARIAEVTERLALARREHDEASRELSRVEVAAGAAARELAELRTRVAAREAELARLAGDRERLEPRLADQRDSLARHLRAAYVAGRRDRLKLLFNQEDPATLSRALGYYEYLARARAADIRALQETLDELARLEARATAAREALSRLAEERAAATRELEARRAERAAVLARARAVVADGETRLGRLQQAERDLVALVEELTRELSDVPITAADRPPFASLRGHLPWPVDGPLRHRFGTPREVGELTWQGVMIDAADGTPVRAVSHGRVAFADWLRGFGLLLIIDHGDGYMSLYGHNRAIFKEVGDWVESGEVVADVGDSGGLGKPGLYFGIRERGQPRDPGRWCDARRGA